MARTDMMETSFHSCVCVIKTQKDAEKFSALLMTKKIRISGNKGFLMGPEISKSTEHYMVKIWD